jgi:hypothetical protein
VNLVAISADKMGSLSIIFHVEDMGTEPVSLLTTFFFHQEDIMIKKKPLAGHRIRYINGSFAWLSHRFISQGFWASLTHHELIVYMFLVIVGDRQGISYYSFDKICSLAAITPDEYIIARDALIDKDLISFDGHLFQVLSLPKRVMSAPKPPLVTKEEMKLHDPATIHQIIKKSFARCRQKREDNATR